MRRLDFALALALALALLAGSRRPARACDCPAFDEAAALARHPLAFDGWVLETPQPWRCPLPPAPRPRAGCVRIAVVDRESCRAHGDLLGLEARDPGGRSAETPTSIEDDATTFCGVAAGRYILTGTSRWVEGEENGTLDHGRTLEVVPGRSYVVYDAGKAGQRLRVGVIRAVKGQLPREVDVTAEADCGTPFFEPGNARRFFGSAGPDGAVVIRGCSSARELTAAERAEPVRPPAAGAAPPAAPSAAPPPPQPPSPAVQPSAPAAAQRGSCAAADPAPALAASWLALALRRRRRRHRRSL